MVTAFAVTSQAGPSIPQLVTAWPGGDGTMCRNASASPATSSWAVTANRGSSSGSLVVSMACGAYRSVTKPRLNWPATTRSTSANAARFAGNDDRVTGKEKAYGAVPSTRRSLAAERARSSADNVDDSDAPASVSDPNSQRPLRAIFRTCGQDR